ncbi:methyltransferase FkbM family [Oleidesulfovibrio alaskensis G20]|jgi:hypothetical protein|uniref:Methyltransferase FkbM family n=1 Tax=Oleidesulfovibrio alaskensis (strain ATCC BAA-1058 / DSM 17464 / G20) TaxID=207559 RepID=Q30XC6_OLEA2|nr:glycosyltransferase family 10 [Oleidesulfovibrio alaskensis]ABB39670.2 methyltransferase FkbM family [Oleidesulfovibrio alaskensis G20]
MMSFSDKQVCCLLATEHVPWPWLRQTSGGKGVVGSVRFKINEDQQGDADWLVVVDSPPENLYTRVPFDRRILFITEPPEVKVYSPSFLKQFYWIISPYLVNGATGRCLLENSCLPWQFGVDMDSRCCNEPFGDLDNLVNYEVPVKRHEISVVCSTKAITNAQKQRLAFVKTLSKRLGDRLHIYGRGVSPVRDKATAIIPYRYHIVLENNRLDNFWTEKFSDALLGWSLPLYAGAGNLEKALPANGIIQLPIDNHEEAIAVVERVLRDDPYMEYQPALAKCREWCLKNTNIFFRVATLIENSMVVNSSRLLDKHCKILKTTRVESAIYRRLRRWGLFSAESN